MKLLPLRRSLAAVVLPAALLVLGGLSHASAQGIPIEPTILPTPVVPAPPVPPIVQQWCTTWNTGDAKGMAALFVPAGIYEDFAFQAKSQSQAGVAQWVAITAKNIPNAHMQIIEAIQQGDRAAVKWIFSGTPGALGTTPSTGKSFAVAAVSFFELRGNRIVRVSDFYNLADILRQLGLPADSWTPPAAKPGPSRTTGGL